MATEVQTFLDAVEEKNWDKAHDLLQEILYNPNIDKRTVLSGIEDLYPKVVEDMLNIKMGRQPLKKSRPTFDDDDDLETSSHLTRLQNMSVAQAKAEEQNEEVIDLIKILRWKLDEEEKVLTKQNAERVEALYAEQAAAAGRQLEQQHLSGKKRSPENIGGKSRRKRKNKTAKKTKRRKTVKRRKTNKTKYNKKRQ
jgi:hypothetical protein